MVIGDDNNLMRVEQAKELMLVMKKQQGLQILTGDFNVSCFETDAEKIKIELKVFAQNGFVDTFDKFQCENEILS